MKKLIITLCVLLVSTAVFAQQNLIPVIAGQKTIVSAGKKIHLPKEIYGKKETHWRLDTAVRFYLTKGEAYQVALRKKDKQTLTYRPIVKNKIQMDGSRNLLVSPGLKVLGLQSVLNSSKTAIWYTDNSAVAQHSVRLVIVSQGKILEKRTFTEEKYAEIIKNNPIALDLATLPLVTSTAPQSAAPTDVKSTLIVQMREKWITTFSHDSLALQSDLLVRKISWGDWLYAIDFMDAQIADTTLLRIFDTLKTFQVVSVQEADTVAGLDTMYSHVPQSRFRGHYVCPLSSGEDLNPASPYYVSEDSAWSYFTKPLLVVRYGNIFGLLARGCALAHEGDHVLGGDESQAIQSEMKLLQDINPGFTHFIDSIASVAPIFKSDSILNDTTVLYLGNSIYVSKDFAGWFFIETDAYIKFFLLYARLNPELFSADISRQEIIFWLDSMVFFTLSAWADTHYESAMAEKVKMEMYSHLGEPTHH